VSGPLEWRDSVVVGAATPTHVSADAAQEHAVGIPEIEVSVVVVAAT
jgi:hypothetical protein